MHKNQRSAQVFFGSGWLSCGFIPISSSHSSTSSSLCRLTGKKHSTHRQRRRFGFRVWPGCFTERENRGSGRRGQAESSESSECPKKSWVASGNSFSMANIGQQHNRIDRCLPKNKILFLYVYIIHTNLYLERDSHMMFVFYLLCNHLNRFTSKTCMQRC